MKIEIAPHETADRLADAALLLLDAARAAVAEQERASGNSQNRMANAIAIAVQAVTMADHWPAGGLKNGASTMTPNQMIDTMKGAALGLGMVTAAVPIPAVRLALLMVINSSVVEGQQHGLEVRKRLGDGQ